MNHLLLTQDVLNISEITSIVSADSCGAISLFVGTTRDNFEGKKVLSLEYEAYEPMALKQMGVICEELRRQWPDIVNIAIYHRLGSVPVMESSVVIAISSPHRKTSLNAVESAIEELKKRVPIWKKEKYEDNGCSWKENKEFKAYDSHKSLFDERICDLDEPYKLSTQMVQISASENEIKRRINCFVEKKRNEIDLCNIMDYTEKKRSRGCENNTNLYENEEHNDLETCARVNSIIIKQEYSKGHLKVRCVENNVGPQMRPDYLHALDKLMTFNEKNQKQKILSITNMENHNSCTYQNNPLENLKYSAITERIENIEQHINISPINVTDIYERLKIIEKRILHLESISPEYRHFLCEFKPCRAATVIINYLHALDKLMTFNEKNQKQKILSITNMENHNSCTYQNNPLENLKYSAITERIENIEQHINISPINVTDIYERLKIIEKRILHLESISPEYRHFLQDKCNTENANPNFGNYKDGTVKLGFSALERKTYNADDIGAIIQDIENYNPVFDM